MQMNGACRPEVCENFLLTNDEERIFKTLLDVINHFGLSTQPRAAGGWVRDKLLGRTSSDIDIALDDMLGKQFAEKVNEYLAEMGMETHGIGVITSNPDQSKHLETATMRVHGMWVDFVNLRSESYAEDSRIPSMDFGTPEQDALRRDLTINSLFYNIREQCVEDFTGRGLQDLRDGIIRTPLPARATFLDDPLRVLRAVRFGVRYGFTLDEELVEAAGCDLVRNALASKVSRERVGVETDLMLASVVPGAPLQAMRHLCRLRLLPVVLRPPREAQGALGEDYARYCVAAMSEVCDVLSSVPQVTLEKDQLRLCMYTALLLPLREMAVPAGGSKSKKIPLAEVLLKDSLKLKNRDVALVVSALSLVDECGRLLGRVREDNADATALLGRCDEPSPTMVTETPTMAAATTSDAGPVPSSMAFTPTGMAATPGSCPGDVAVSPMVCALAGAGRGVGAAGAEAAAPSVAQESRRGSSFQGQVSSQGAVTVTVCSLGSPTRASSPPSQRPRLSSPPPPSAHAAVAAVMAPVCATAVLERPTVEGKWLEPTEEGASGTGGSREAGVTAHAQHFKLADGTSMLPARGDGAWEDGGPAVALHGGAVTSAREVAGAVSLQAGAEEAARSVPEAAMSPRRRKALAEVEAALRQQEFRVAAGLLLRQTKEMWPMVVVLASVLDSPLTMPWGQEPITPQHVLSVDSSGVVLGRPPRVAGGLSPGGSLLPPFDARAKLVEDFGAAVLALGLDNVWDMKPALNGKEVMQLLPSVKGPQLGAVLEALLTWQLGNPSASTDECKQWLKASYAGTAK
eukprot:jgi/Mesvir1/21439/Mv20907-RA.1